MTKLLMFSLLLLPSCAALAPVTNDLEKMVDDNAVKVEISREALQEDKELYMKVEIKKDLP